MDAEFTSWAYLKAIVGNFDALLSYYFLALMHYAPLFRKTGVGLLYSLGLAWIGLATLKAPFDKFKAVLGGFGMVVFVGWLMSPTTNTTAMGDGAGAELSVGGYYTYFIAGSFSHILSSGVGSIWNSSVGEAGGIAGGPTGEAIALAYAADGKRFAKIFEDSDGIKAFEDYTSKCGAAVLEQNRTNDDIQNLKTIGIGANTLGLDSSDATMMAQYQKRLANGSVGWLEKIGMAFMQAEGGAYQAERYETAALEQKKQKAIEFLKNRIPDANNSFTGDEGYRIPTQSYYKQRTDKNADPNNSSPSYVSLNDTSTDLAKLKANGVESVSSGTGEEYVFRPKNCYDMYLVAEASFRNFREAVKDNPEFKNLDVVQAYQSLSAGSAVRKGAVDQVNEEAKKNGVTGNYDSSAVEDMSSNAAALFTEISNKYNKWMLEFKIPAMISGMALLAVILLITFPIFGLLSIFVGPKILITYLKMMFLPFLVVFTNDMMLTMSANLIAYNKAMATVANSFNPDQVSLPYSLAVQNTELIVYSVITFAEMVIIKLLLWDDVKSATSFNAGQAATNAAGTGFKIASFVAKMVGSGGKAAMATGPKMAAAQRASQSVSALQNISRQVTQMASQSHGRTGRGGGGTGGPSGITPLRNPNGGGKPPSSSGPGGSSNLNPPKP